jgi:hypothetical protein
MRACASFAWASTCSRAPRRSPSRGELVVVAQEQRPLAALRIAGVWSRMSTIGKRSSMQRHEETRHHGERPCGTRRRRRNSRPHPPATGSLGQEHAVAIPLVDVPRSSFRKACVSGRFSIRALALVEIRHRIEAQAVTPSSAEIEGREDGFRTASARSSVGLVRIEAVPVMRLRVGSHVQFEGSKSWKMTRASL